MTPNRSDNFLIMGRGYLNVSIASIKMIKENNLDTTDSTWIATLYNLTLSLELYLKNYLKMKGITDKDLSNNIFGHDIEKIFHYCLVAGLRNDLNRDDAIDAITNMISASSEDYKNHNYRYLSKKELKGVSNIKGLETSVESLKVLESVKAEKVVL